MLTSRAAAAGQTMVRVVTAAGRVSREQVLTTSDPGVVELRGTLRLPPLRRTTGSHSRQAITVRSGPLARTARTGRLHGRHGATTVPSTRSLDGAPVLDSHDEVLGLATLSGTHLRVIPLARLRVPLSARPVESSPSLIQIVLLLFIFGLATGVAGILMRRRVTRQGRRSTIEFARLRAPRQSPAPLAESEHDVQIVLRRRPPDEPLSNVTLQRRPPAERT